MLGQSGILSDQRRETLIEMYRDGQTLQEIGDRLGVTRERVRQLTNKLVASGGLERRLRRRGYSEKGRESARAKRAARPKEDLQREPIRNARIEELVKQGLTYSQVADLVGCTRNVVCTVIYRAKRR